MSVAMIRVARIELVVGSGAVGPAGEAVSL